MVLIFIISLVKYFNIWSKYHDTINRLSSYNIEANFMYLTIQTKKNPPITLYNKRIWFSKE